MGSISQTSSGLIVASEPRRRATVVFQPAEFSTPGFDARALAFNTNNMLTDSPKRRFDSLTSLIVNLASVSSFHYHERSMLLTIVFVKPPPAPPRRISLCRRGWPGTVRTTVETFVEGQWHTQQDTVEDMTTKSLLAAYSAVDDEIKLDGSFAVVFFVGGKEARP